MHFDKWYNSTVNKIDNKLKINDNNKSNDSIENLKVDLYEIWKNIKLLSKINKNIFFLSYLIMFPFILIIVYFKKRKHKKITLL